VDFLQIKFFIVGILIGSGYLIGEYVQKVFVNRHKQINELIRVLELIRIEISFSMYTLEEIFSHMISKTTSDYKNFFFKMQRSLRREDGKSLDEILNENINILKTDTYLKEEELMEFKKLLLSLGSSDVNSQQRMIDLTIENLKKRTGELKEDVYKKGNLYKKLITFSVIAICIILY
jgi:stage III sporulation protein AB